MGTNLLQLLVGAVLLYYGAEFLINGSKSIAEKFNIPPIIVGITLVAFGIAGLSGVDPWMAISLLAIVWGVMGIFWQHNWQHKMHGHHHHPKPKEDN